MASGVTRRSQYHNISPKSCTVDKLSSSLGHQIPCLVYICYSIPLLKDRPTVDRNKQTDKNVLTHSLKYKPCSVTKEIEEILGLKRCSGTNKAWFTICHVQLSVSTEFYLSVRDMLGGEGKDVSRWHFDTQLPITYSEPSLTVGTSTKYTFNIVLLKLIH